MSQENYFSYNKIDENEVRETNWGPLKKFIYQGPKGKAGVVVVKWEEM